MSGSWNRRWSVFAAGVLILVCAVVFVVAPRAAQGDRRAVWAIESPSPQALQALAAERAFTVRWVESGLVVFEGDPASLPPSEWAARSLGVRPHEWDLAIARAGATLPAGPARRAPSLASQPLVAAAGSVQVGLVQPGESELDGCHGGAFRAPQTVDPRTLLDAGPPAALAPYAAANAQRRPLPAALARVVESVSPDSIDAWVDMLAISPGAQPADRFVRNDDLQTLYIPLVERTMRRLVEGIPGAVVELHEVVLDASTTTHNVIARIPGSPGGFGTFVVSAHIDATGSQDPAWVADVGAGLPVFTPGAEDNASGCAAVLEALRCVAGGIRSDSLDFGVDFEFIAFTAEEIGLVGSDRYVREPRPLPFLGCINLDMVGYNDSLPGNLSIAHNPQSHWLASWVADATNALPGPRVTPALALDETRSSDHNSFWTVGAAGILLSDAPVGTLRRYDTYHRPIDVASRVDNVKLTQVTQAAVASLVRFDTDFASEPEIVFEPTDLQLRYRVNQQFFRYVPGFHQVVPGSPLFAVETVHSLGAPFTGTLRFELATSRGSESLAFFDSVLTVSLPTGAQFVLRRQIPILAGDAGWHQLETRVTSQATGGAPVTSSAQDSFLVDSAPVPEFTARVRPNPVRDLTTFAVEFTATGFPGQADIEIYDVEGQRVATFPSMTPLLASDKYTVQLTASNSPGGALDLASGAYFVRLRWRDAAGGTADAVAPMAVAR